MSPHYEMPSALGSILREPDHVRNEYISRSDNGRVSGDDRQLMPLFTLD